LIDWRFVETDFEAAAMIVGVDFGGGWHLRLKYMARKD
jgi:hypothetical protein